MITHICLPGKGARREAQTPGEATLPCRGRVGSPKAIRGGVAAVRQATATQHVRKRCHPTRPAARADLPLQGR
jgi:hypothetical protein